jgi:predicted NodU family carbamoyl transferase
MADNPADAGLAALIAGAIVAAVEAVRFTRKKEPEIPPPQEKPARSFEALAATVGGLAQQVYTLEQRMTAQEKTYTEFLRELNDSVDDLELAYAKSSAETTAELRHLREMLTEFKDHFKGVKS